MNQIYFTADLHFGHSNILKHSPKRPFSDTVDIVAHDVWLLLDGIYVVARLDDHGFTQNIQSCLDYLQSQLDTGLWRVMDEYGETIPVLELEKRIRKSLDGITLREYYQKHPEERQWGAYGPQQKLASDGSRWWDEDFW